MKRIALIFPGIGYTAERPLLYYARKIAAAAGFEPHTVPYTGLPDGAKGSAKKLRQACGCALEQAERLLGGIDFGGCDTLLCVSKSIGTAVAAAYTAAHGLSSRNVFYTPVAPLFDFPLQDGIVFHGSADPWIGTEELAARCDAAGLPLSVIPGANHSLETGDAAADIRILADVMRQTALYVGSLAGNSPAQL